MSLTIDPAQGLLVTAPAATPIPRLDKVVRAKARWVTQRLRQGRGLPLPSEGYEFVSGETFLYLGRQYRLRLLPGRASGAVRLHGGWLELPVPRGLREPERAAYVRAELMGWYRRRAAERVPEWAQPWARKAGVTIASVLAVDQSKRWGSCSNGVLRVNWRVMQAPRALVDYVLAHEVVHLLHENHGRAYWSALGRAMPDYEARKRRLREVGLQMEW